MRAYLCLILCSVACVPWSSERAHGDRPERADVGPGAAGATSEPEPRCERCEEPAQTASAAQRAPRTAIRVGTSHSVTLSIDIAPPPAASFDCSTLVLTLVGPRSAAVGERVSLQAHAGEPEGARVQYAWLGPEPELVSDADHATFLCAGPGEHTLGLKLIEPAACSTEQTFTIDCLEMP